ncbi:MAG: PhoH family protein [Lentisphaerae bacterium]|nr:PhoH family protein [Lentisphaerota bacterium]
MKKTFVLDTNVLLHNSNCIEAFADNTVVIPMAVIEELDKFKGNNDELGRNARQVIRRLDRLRKQGRLGEGVPMANGGVLRIFIGAPAPAAADLDATITDNKIIRVALQLQQSGERVIFVSKDINARIKSDALGIETMDFEKQKVNFEELFTGYRLVRSPRGQIEAFERDGRLAVPGLEAAPNEFIVLTDEQNPQRAVIARFRPGNVLAPLSPRSNGAWNIKARSKEQRMALELLFDEKITLVTLVGQAGTGKTLLALAAGLDLTVKAKRYDKMLVSRPIMPLGKDIGFLPGDKESKLMNWMQPIFDNLAFLLRDGSDAKHPVREKIERLQREHVVELEALTYIRGRSIPRQYVIIDEAQNLTPHEIKTIVSRSGDGTKMVLTGDPSQIDNPYLDSNSNGLSYAVERLKDSPLHGHVTLMQSERSTLAALAADRL